MMGVLPLITRVVVIKKKRRLKVFPFNFRTFVKYLFIFFPKSNKKIQLIHWRLYFAKKMSQSGFALIAKTIIRLCMVTSYGPKLVITGGGLQRCVFRPKFRKRFFE